MVANMPGNEEPKDSEDFEEATNVRKIDKYTWEGNYPLKLPLSGARGVYGGHTCAQTLLVAMKSAPGYLPHSFHSHFIKAGDPKIKCLYKVTYLRDDDNFCQRQINLIQKGQVTYTAMCSLTKKDLAFNLGTTDPEFVHRKPYLAIKHRDPSKLYKTYHTDFIVNAFSDEFLSYENCPEEKDIPPSERWVSLWSKMHQPQKSKMNELLFNLVGLAHLSDAAVLTTLARALHLDWNPTVANMREDFDEGRDAREIMNVSLNAMHLYHYTAMSLDHHIYFHLNDISKFDILNDWLSLTYQFKVSKNSRTLVRGHFFDRNDRCVATFVQEGLTFMRPGVLGSAGKKFSKI